MSNTYNLGSDGVSSGDGEDDLQGVLPFPGVDPSMRLGFHPVEASNFDDALRRVLANARLQALTAGHQSIEVDHLGLALANGAVSELRAAGVTDTAELQREILVLVHTTPGQAGLSRTPPRMANGLAALLYRALACAKDADRDVCGVADVLAALAEALAANKEVGGVREILRRHWPSVRQIAKIDEILELANDLKVALPQIHAAVREQLDQHAYRVGFASRAQNEELVRVIAGLGHEVAALREAQARAQVAPAAPPPKRGWNIAAWLGIPVRSRALVSSS